MSDPGFPDLRTFLEQLRREGDLAVVDVPVNPDQEVAEIHRRVIAAGGPALLFADVEGADFPLVTNLYGTPHRAEMAFGRRPFQLIRSWWASRKPCSRRPSARSGVPATWPWISCESV